MVGVHRLQHRWTPIRSIQRHSYEIAIVLENRGPLCGRCRHNGPQLLHDEVMKIITKNNINRKINIYLKINTKTMKAYSNARFKNQEEQREIENLESH